MTSEELLAAANEASPELLEKTAKALMVLEQWSPEFASELADDISTITGSTLEKTAAFDWSGVRTNAKGLAMTAAGGVALGLAGAMAGDLYDAAKIGRAHV